MNGPDLGSLRARLVLPFALVLGVVAMGTLGYHLLWRDTGGTWLDAPFMTVTTITTVGHGEGRPIADNRTADGRATNRRVTAEISETVTRTQ